MPSQLKPCPNPNCESRNVDLNDDRRSYTDTSFCWWVECGSCGMRGPRARRGDWAIAEWNGMPRAPFSCDDCPEGKWRELALQAGESLARFRGDYIWNDGDDATLTALRAAGLEV